MPGDPSEAEAWQQEFGQRVRVLREERAVSQMALSHEVGIHPTYLSDVERGQRNVSLVNIRRIARALGVSPADLFS